MTPPEPVPRQDLSRVADAQQRFGRAIGGLDDLAVARPSTLPGWTVGHVLAHVARNADSHTRRAEAASRGEVIDQYEGGYEGRAAEIERGALRPAAELVADVEISAARLDAAWRAVPDDAWGNETLDVGGRRRPLHALPGRRWQELEVHLLDLDVGLTPHDWPNEFVDVWLPRLREGLPERLTAGGVAPPPGALDPRDELAWLYGRPTRADRPDLPELTPWR